MYINLQGLAEGIEYRLTETFLPQETFFCGRDIKFAQPAQVDAYYTILHKSAVEVKGTVEAKLRAACDCCLEDLSLDVKAKFNEIFTLDGGNDTYTYQGFKVELDGMLSDCLNHRLPSKLLCTEECKGLCQICGANLNITDCGCVTVNSPFAILKSITGGAKNGSTKK